MDFLIDTPFLVHRWREGGASAEQRFIEAHRDLVVGMPWIVKGEFLRGAVLANHADADVAEFLGRYRIVWPDEETLVIYAKTYADLARSKQMIGPNDLWIAAAALRSGLPLLTRNVREFRRVSSLKVEDYSR
jgi:tRNA(fMet)-specific endonuclease VapC